MTMHLRQDRTSRLGKVVGRLTGWVRRLVGHSKPQAEEATAPAAPRITLLPPPTTETTKPMGPEREPVEMPVIVLPGPAAPVPEEVKAPAVPKPVTRKPAPPPAPAPVPAPTPAIRRRKAGQWLKEAFANEAGQRRYRVYVPAGYDGAGALVVMLHGCTQSPEDFAAGTRMNKAADRDGFVVAYPEQCSHANRTKCWNWFNSSDQKRGRGEPSLIAGITWQVMEDHRIDPRRVYVAGLSAGGAASAIMGATYPDLYAAIGIHSGLAAGIAGNVLSAYAAMKAVGLHLPRRHDGPLVPTIIFHGEDDDVVHHRNGEMILRQAARQAKGKLHNRVERGAAANGHGFTRTVLGDGHGGSMVEHWLVHGGGHVWFGGSPKGTYADPRGPDATREMLRFFAQHAHP